MTDRLPSSQSDRAVLLLRELLLQGAFPAGERLTELGLVPKLGVSRTPVRHALARLAQEGLLEEVAGGGFRARACTVDEIWDAIELRGILEGSAARLAAERATGTQDLATLTGLVSAMNDTLPKTLADFAAYVRLNEQFHREVWRLSGNGALISTIEHVVSLPFAAPGALVFGEAELPEARRTAELAQSQHRAIADAIARRQGARAEAIAREHALIAWENLRRALDDRTLFARLPGAALVRMPPAV